MPDVTSPGDKGPKNAARAALVASLSQGKSSFGGRSPASPCSPTPSVPKRASLATTASSTANSDGPPARPVSMFSDVDPDSDSQVSDASDARLSAMSAHLRSRRSQSPATPIEVRLASPPLRSMSEEDDFSWQHHCEHRNSVAIASNLACMAAALAVGVAAALTHDPQADPGSASVALMTPDEGDTTAVEVLVDSDTPGCTPPSSPPAAPPQLTAAALEAAASVMDVNSGAPTPSFADIELQRARQREEELLLEIEHLRKAKEQTDNNESLPRLDSSRRSVGVVEEPPPDGTTVLMKLSSGVVSMSVVTREGDWLIEKPPKGEVLPEEFFSAQIKEYTLARNVCVVVGVFVFPFAYPFLKALPTRAGAQKGLAINLAGVSLIFFTLTIVFFVQESSKVIGFVCLGIFFALLALGYQMYIRGRRKKMRFMGTEAEDYAKARATRKAKHQRKGPSQAIRDSMHAGLELET